MSWKILLLVFLISIIPRFIFTGIILKVNKGNVSVLVRDDAIRYRARALALLNKDFIIDDKSSHTLNWDVPLFPLFTSASFKIFSSGVTTAVFLNILLFGLSSCVLYAIGAELFGRFRGICPALIYSFYPTLMMCSIYPIPEPLFMLFLLLGSYNFVLFLEREYRHNLFFCALFLGLSTLTKEIGAFLPLLAILIIAIRFIGNWLKIIKYALFLGIVYLLVLLPVVMYNYNKLGKIELSDKVMYQLSVVKTAIDGAVADKDIGHNFNTAVKDYFYDRRRFFAGTGTFALMRALGNNVDNLVILQRRSPVKYLCSLRNFGMGWIIFQLCALFFIGCMYLFSFLAWLFLIAKRKYKEVAYSFLILLYFLLGYSQFFNSTYFIPLVPLFAVLCTYALVVLSNKNQGNKSCVNV